jgi:biotin operon repressor
VTDLLSSDKLQALNRASQDTRLGHSDFRVYQRLVNHMNPQTGACYPSNETLAKATGLGERAVRKCIGRLEDLGYVVRRIQPGRSRSNRYLLPDLKPGVRARKGGSSVPKMRNHEPPEKKKEKEKEKREMASEGKGALAVRGLSLKSVEARKVSLQETHNRLARALGDGKEGWEIMMKVPESILGDLIAQCSAGTVSMEEAAFKVASYAASSTRSADTDDDRPSAG